AGLRGRHPKAWKRTTIGGDHPVAAPDLIGRDFTAAHPDTRWCGDVTYIRTWDGWAYLATVIDLHSRAVVGWAIAGHMRTSLVTAALDMAIAARNPAAGVIFHSDRGCQYTSSVFDAYCTKNNIRRSLGRTGICYDNAVSESFFATYKKELIHTRPWPTLAYLERETCDWIGNYYNTIRRHSALGYLQCHVDKRVRGFEVAVALTEGGCWVFNGERRRWAGMPAARLSLRAGGRFHRPAAGCAWGCGDGGRRGGWFRRRWGRRPRSGRVLSGLAGGGRRPGSPGGPWFCGRGAGRGLPGRGGGPGRRGRDRGSRGSAR